MITFKNKASRPYSISAHGVQASGTHVPVKPGEENFVKINPFFSRTMRRNVLHVLLSSGYLVELTWDIPESSGPGVSDPNCISYAYYSNVDFIKVHNKHIIDNLLVSAVEIWLIAG